jgi:hypothetical protein
MHRTLMIVALLGASVAAAACSAAGNGDGASERASSALLVCPPGQIKVCDPTGNGHGVVCDCEDDTNPPVVDSGPPAVVTSIPFQEIASSDYTFYGTQTYDGPWAMGLNDKGQLGTGNTTSRLYSDYVQGFPAFPGNMMHMIVAGDAFGCAADSQNVWCWGARDGGALGDGLAVIQNPGPQVANRVAYKVNGVFTSLTTAFQLAAGGTHACALLNSNTGDVWCWGNVASGSPPTLYPMPFFTGAGQIAAGRNHTCALRAQDGAVFCWGSNVDGQLGLPVSTYAASMPVQVPGLVAKNIFAGGDSTCAQKLDGSYACWGDNSGQQFAIGASQTVVFGPTPAPALAGATSLAFGPDHSCGVFGELGQGQARCWGDNNNGQLGVGYRSSGAAWPLTVIGLDAVEQVTVGRGSSCAHRGDGSVWCWGFDAFTSKIDSTSPQKT